MRRTLFGKLLLVVLSFCILMTAACIFLMRAWHDKYHAQVDQIANRDTAQLIAQSDFFYDAESASVSDYHKAIATLAELNPAWEAYLLDDSGSIVASSVSQDNIVRNSVDVRPIQAFLDGAADLPIVGDDPQTLAGQEVFSASEISIPGCPADFLYLVLHRSDESSDLRGFKASQAIGETIRILLLTSILGVLAALVVMRMLTRNLGRLETAMQQFRADGFAALPAEHLPKESRFTDEVDRLTQMFWELAERLRNQMNAIRRGDEKRREMLANVSHDLRTPLAVLSAHLETLDLAPELEGLERDEYLKTCIRQCNALGTLVEQLLEAARIDAGEVDLHQETFHVGELLHDVAQKFRLRAKKSNVELTVDCLRNLPLVQGDIGLIERVLDNLLDNAFDYVGPQGRIEISASVCDGRVRVEVRDTGSGLTPEEVNQVMERFYRGDAGRSSGGGHVGLGLAIVKGIVELHGGQFQLESEEGVGTRCTFDLPVA